LYLWLSVALLLFFCSSLQAQVAPDKVFPESTRGYFSISNVKEFADKWRETQFGKLLKDPLMESFEKELRSKIDEKWFSKLGLSFDDFSSFPAGSMSGGLIAVPGQTPGLILVAELNKDKENGNQETMDFLKRMGEKLETQGAKKSTGVISEGTNQINTNIYTFPPATQDSKITPMVIYLVTQNYLVVTDQENLARMMVARLSGKISSESLGDKPAYQAIMKRVTKDDPPGTSHLIKWYVEPLKLTAAIQLMVEKPKDAPKPKVNVYDLLVKHGLEGVQGVGGVVNLMTDQYQSSYRTFFYAPLPRDGAIMKMLVFPNQTDYTPPGWVPDKTAKYTVFHVSPKDIFSNIGPVFNDLAQDTSGVWEDVLKGFEKDPYGPQINIEKEIIDLLDSQVTVLTNYTLPLTENSEQFVIVIKLKPGVEEKFKKSFPKLLGENRDMIQTEQDGHIFWQPKPAAMRAAEKAAQNNRSIVPNKKRATKQEPKEEEKTAEDFFPDGAITITKGYVFLANHKDYLLTVLKESGTGSKLEKSEDFQRVKKEIVNLSNESPTFIQVFSRSAEVIQPTYEMIRNKKVPQSRTFLSWLLGELLAPPQQEKEEAKTEIDTGKMPDFEKIRHYLGSGGMFGITEENGWYTQGFQIK